MNKIKDFFYNKNDLIIVLLILAAAAFLILNRLDVIMQSPAKLVENNKQTQVTEEYTEPSTEAADDSEE